MAVVVGAQGGIGRSLIRHLSNDRRYDRLIGLSRRQPDDCPADSRQYWLPIDLCNEDSIAEAAASIATLGCPTRVVVATGRLHDKTRLPEKTIRALDPKAAMDLYAINAIGPAMVAKHLLPLMPRDAPHVFAVLSARVGSIGDNRLGGWYSYRASKAALNMMIRCLAVEHRRTHPLGICIALHPGTVATRLTQPFRARIPTDSLLDPDRSAEHLLGVIDRLSPADSGGFFAWNGEAIAW